MKTYKQCFNEAFGEITAEHPTWGFMKVALAAEDRATEKFAAQGDDVCESIAEREWEAQYDRI